MGDRLLVLGHRRTSSGTLAVEAGVGGEGQAVVGTLRKRIVGLALGLVVLGGWPAVAAADPVATITLDRDGPVTLLVQSKSALNVLGIAVTSPVITPVCADCRGGEALALGAMSRGTEIVLRLEDGQKTFLSSDPLHARIDRSGGTWRVGFDDANGDGDFEDLIVTVAVPTLPPPVDQDADGVSPPTDCLDTNSAVRPGAPEIAGNGLDDDCVGGDAPGRVAAVVTLGWDEVRAGGVRLKKLEVRDAPPFAQIVDPLPGQALRLQDPHREGRRDRWREAPQTRPGEAQAEDDDRRRDHRAEHDRQGPPLRGPQARHDRRPDALPPAGSDELGEVLRVVTLTRRQT